MSDLALNIQEKIQNPILERLNHRTKHLLPVEVCVTKEASPGSSERHHWQRDRNGNIHPNLAGKDSNLV